MARTPLEKTADPDLGDDLIPKERYTCTDFARREWERMWTKVWLLAGRESDAPNSGDYFTFEIGTESVLVVRQKDGTLAAHFNVCRHRGNRLCDPGLGHAASFACRFHGWVYGIDGALRFVTDAHTFPQGIRAGTLGLRPLRCETWGGFVWVSFDPAAEPLLDYLGIIPEHLDPYHFEEQKILNDVTLEIDCNWKTCVDAFNEAYHIQATHPTLTEYSDDVDVQIDCYERHTRFLFKIGVPSPRRPNPHEITPTMRDLIMRTHGVDPDRFTGTAQDVRASMVRAMREEIGPQSGLDFSELDDRQLVDDLHYTVFPNVTFNIHARGAWVFRHRPHPEDPNRMFFDFWNLLRAPQADIPRPVREQHRGGGYSLAVVPGGDVLDEDV